MFRRFWGIVLCGAFSVACNSSDNAGHEAGVNTEAKVLKEEKSAGAGTYDVSTPAKKWVLPDELKEISGNYWLDNNHLLVVEDLHAILYVLRLDEEAVIEKKIPFINQEKDKLDMEDVTVAADTAYVLWSHGSIFKVTDWKSTPKTEEFPTDLNKKNNSEGLCLDPVTGNLLLACKDKTEDDDEKKSTRAVYEFDVNTDKLKPEPFLLIHKKDFKPLLGESLDFYPSAIAVHPASRDIYVLSTRENKLLAQYARSGELKAAQMINSELLPQPEGICFSPEGIMYISSEGKKDGHAVICQFVPKK